MWSAGGNTDGGAVNGEVINDGVGDAFNGDSIRGMRVAVIRRHGSVGRIMCVFGIVSAVVCPLPVPVIVSVPSVSVLEQTSDKRHLGDTLILEVGDRP